MKVLFTTLVQSVLVFSGLCQTLLNDGVCRQKIADSEFAGLRVVTSELQHLKDRLSASNGDEQQSAVYRLTLAIKSISEKLDYIISDCNEIRKQNTDSIARLQTGIEQIQLEYSNRLNNLSTAMSESSQKLDQIAISFDHAYKQDYSNTTRIKERINQMTHQQSSLYSKIETTIKNATQIVTSQLQNVQSNMSRQEQSHNDTESKLNELQSSTSSLRQTLSNVDSTSSSIKQTVTAIHAQLCSDVSLREAGRIRLANGGSNYGRLEVYIDGKGWGTVCDDGFKNISANVACKQLGYSNGYVKGSAHYGKGTLDILMDDVYCGGLECSIQSCRHKRNHNCFHSEDVGVECH